MVGAAHNLDTSGYTIPYVASWASAVEGKTPTEVVQATGERVRAAAVTILNNLTTVHAGDGDPPGLVRQANAAEQTPRAPVPPRHGAPARRHTIPSPAMPGL